jgi:TonB family protein
MSISAHVIVLATVAFAARPATGEPQPEEQVIYHPPASPPPVCSDCLSGAGGKPGRASTSRAPTLPGPFEGVPDFDIPDGPGPSISESLVSDEDWDGGFSGRPSGTDSTVPGREGVDREVVPRSTNPAPRYPASLRAANIQGSVFARFVVDTMGWVRMETVKIDASDHPLFSEAVIDALRRSRYAPAELRGRKVPQLVVQPFVFVLQR